ncbi:MAG: heme-binding protein [Acidobacteria bacterium]|nr:heme-binding protein [Acidobacteriota bacterium]
MKRKTVMLTTIIATLALILIGLLAWSIVGSRGEQPKYAVVSVKNDIEVRDYAPMIVAEVEATGEREEAITKGFSILADYIFGNNKSSSKVAMTAPVTQQESRKIAMTAPVTQQNVDGKWQVRFMMPSNYNLSSLPQPNNAAIQLNEVPSKRFVVIRFSGIPTESVLKKNLEKLQDHIRDEKIKTVTEPTYAFYNPPWTLPPMRRTEIMIEISK